MPSRRRFLQGFATLAATGFGSNASLLNQMKPQLSDFLKGHIRHSAAFWCFNSRGEKWSLEKMCDHAVTLGCKSVELIDPKHWDTLRRYGLLCAIVPNGMPGETFKRGLNNSQFHAEVIERTRATIEKCARAKYPNVIAFVG
jgi:hydroxypyruvate isomerase